MRNKPWRMVKKLSVLRYPSKWEPPLGISPDSCQMHFVFSWNYIFAAPVISQYQKKWPAKLGQPVRVQTIRVKMWNLIFSLCNQRTDKVQICSTDIHGQVILPSYLKPNDSLLSGYLLKQTPHPGLLIHVFCQTEIRATQCRVTAQPWDGAAWKTAVLIAEVYGAKIMLPHSPWWRWEQRRQQQRPLSAGQWGTVGQGRPGKSKPTGRQGMARNKPFPYQGNDSTPSSTG